jgi:hypothetical protein
VVMKGLQMGNRAIMYIGAHPEFKKDDYGNSVVSFKNCKNEYYSSNIYRRIWTFKQLLRWRRLVGVDTKCLARSYFKWRRV